jgi:hypothetical protein
MDLEWAFGDAGTFVNFEAETVFNLLAGGGRNGRRKLTLTLDHRSQAPQRIGILVAFLFYLDR